MRSLAGGVLTGLAVSGLVLGGWLGDAWVRSMFTPQGDVPPAVTPTAPGSPEASACCGNSIPGKSSAAPHANAVSIGVMQTGLDPVMIDGRLAGATVSYIAAIDDEAAALGVTLIDSARREVQPGSVARTMVPLSGAACSPATSLTIRAVDRNHVEVGRTALPIRVCAQLLGRAPNSWARTSMVTGRPAQLWWTFLRTERLPKLLGPLPEDWSQMRPIFSFVAPSCRADCHFTLTMLMATAALDSIADPLFGEQQLRMPFDTAGHHRGDCISMRDFIDEVELSMPIRETGRLDAAIDAVESTLDDHSRQLQCP